MSEDVCRLCLSSEELIWIFDDRMSDNMKDIIHATSGVEILETDCVTQKVCITCCQITIRMYKFRTAALNNDKELKVKAQKNKKNIDTMPLKPESSKKRTKITHHPSIQKLQSIYPNIKLPQNLPPEAHFEPYITLITDEVDVWYKERNYTNEEIKRFKSRAVELGTKKKQKCGPKSKVARNCINTTDVHQTTKQILKDLETSLNRINPTNELPSISKINCAAKKIRAAESLGDQTVSANACEDDKTVSPLKIKLNKVARKHFRKQTPVVKAVFSNVDDVIVENISSPKEASKDDSSATSKPLDTEISNQRCESNSKNQVVNITDTETLTISRKRKVLRISSDSEDNSDMGMPPRPPSSTSSSTVTSNASDVPELPYDPLNSSLWSSKSSTVYTCKICNQVYHTMKALKHHEHVRHTKCPFCGKKFHTIALKDKHIKTVCTINVSPVKCKQFKICLTKVDEVEEIRQRYPNAFIRESPVDEVVEPVVEEVVEKVVEENREQVVEKLVEKVIEKELEKVIEEHPPSLFEPLFEMAPPPEIQADEVESPPVQTIEAQTVPDVPIEIIHPSIQESHAKEIELAVQMVKESDHTYDSSSSLLAHEVIFNESPQQQSKRADVICISDDESTPSENISTKPIIRIKDSDTLKGVDCDESATNILKELLMRLHSSNKPQAMDPPKNTAIIGNGKKTLTLKNLKNHLYSYKIPVEIQYGDKLKVMYKYSRTRLPTRKSDTWEKCLRHDLLDQPHTIDNSTAVNPVSFQISSLVSNTQVTSTQVVNNVTSIPSQLNNITSIPNQLNNITSLPNQLNIATSLPNQLQSVQPLQIVNSMAPATFNNSSLMALATSANVAGYPVLLGTTHSITNTQNNYNYLILSHNVSNANSTISTPPNTAVDVQNKPAQCLMISNPKTTSSPLKSSARAITSSPVTLPDSDDDALTMDIDVVSDSENTTTLPNPIPSTSKSKSSPVSSSFGHSVASTSKAKVITRPTPPSIWVKNLKDLMM